MKNSIRAWLITPLIGLFVVPLLLLGAILSWWNYVSEKDQIKSLQLNLATLAADDVSVFLHEHQIRIHSMLNTNYLPDLSLAQQQGLLTRFLRSIKHDRHGAAFSAISLLDDQGREILRISDSDFVQPDDLLTMADADEFTIPATTGQVYYSPIYFKKLTGEPMMKISIPVRDLQSLRLKGVLVSEMTLKFMRHLVATMQIGKSGTAYITDQNGQLLVHPNRSLVHKKTHFIAPARPQIMSGISGSKAVVAAAKINFGNQALFFVTEIPTAEALQHINRAILLLGSFLLLMLIGAMALWFIVVRQIIRPIESLAATARNISRGDFSRMAESRRKDELGDLAIAFNNMTGQLLTTIGDLEKEKNFVKNTIESLTHPFYVIDVNDYTIKLANSASNFGDFKPSDTCHQLTHHSDHPCSGDEHPCVIKEVKKTKKPVVVEHLHSDADGNVSTVEVYGYPIFDDSGEITQVIEYNLDVTEKKNLEAQLFQSQKLEALGSLTGGVAHDFNNYLTTIIGYSQLGIKQLSEEDPFRPRLELIYNAGQKAAALTRQLLAFSRKQVMELKVINLNTLIHNMLKMLGRLVGENIVMEEILRDSIGNIKADPGQVEQIIMNLAVNARDAMPDGGTLFFETDTVVLDAGYCKTHPEVTPGSYVIFSVTDTGHGMTAEVRKKIFDPFYTTKDKGKGTGLGLSTVYGIVKQLHGQIFVYSEPGGTSFKIYFPEFKESGEALEENRAEPMIGGSETILVVDDEPDIGVIVKDTLESLGYEVIVATSGKEALEIANKTDKRFSLLLTDVLMSGMNGRELAERLTTMDQEIKVLFMSGYTDDIITHHGVLEPGIKLISKPLIPNLLALKIRKILDKTGAE
ncbi:MAG: cache domain-containing protein [Thermodesulfobacteriota bacterium]